MILAIIFAQVWGVIQLIVLTSLARTVRVRTALAAMAVGFYAIGPITAFLQLSWIRIAAHVFGKSVLDLTGVASYTVDPFIEEAMKLLPLLVLMLIPAIRRQWSVTDCLLIAAATGSGFGLAEHLFRYADYASTAQSVSGGYAMTIGSATPLVPSIARTLTSWIPLGVFFEGSAVRVNWHLAWSAITGLAVGLFLRNPKKWARFTAAGLLVLVCLNHAAGNAASVQYTWLSPLAAPMRLLDSALALLVLVAVVVAWWIDQPTQRAGMALGPLLAAEQSAPSRLAGTFTAAVSRLPWSISWVLGFDRSRRAYHAARAAAPGTVDDMRDAMVSERDSIDRKLTQQAAPPLLSPAWMPSNVASTVRSALRRPPVIIWLVLIAPSVLYLIVGGFPATSGLQAAMKGPIVWPLILLITLAGQGRSAWRVLAAIRRLPAAARHPVGDDAAMLTLQAATGLGTLSLAGFTFARVLSGVGAGDRMLSTAHAADAMNRTQPAGGAAMASSAGAFDPPPPSPALPGDAAAAASSAGAGDGTSSSSGGSGTSEGSSGDSPHGDDRPGHEQSVNEPRAPSNPAAASDGGTSGDGTPLDTQTEVSSARPGFGDLSASSLGGAFDPPPPSVQLPDEQPADPSRSTSPPPPADEEGTGTRFPDDEEGVGTRVPDDEEGVGTRFPDDAAPVHPKPAAPAPQPTPQDQADDALARSEQADDDAVAARQAKTDAVRAADAAEIKAATKDPASDPDVAAAQARTRAAQNAAERADNAAADGDDPWDPNAPNKSAADAFEREAKEAKAAQGQAESEFNKRQAADPDVAAAKAAASQAQDAQSAADAQAAAAHQNAVSAQANADAAAAKAASDAARAANPAQAAADDAKKALADAQAAENDAFFHRDAQGYRDARAALDAARQKAADAQAAADAAKDGRSASDHTRVKKP